MNRFLIVIFFISCHATQVVAQMRGDVSLLLEAKNAIDRNLDGIATWRGTVVQEHEGQGPGRVGQMGHSGDLKVRIEFIYLADGNRLRTDARMGDGTETSDLRTRDSFITSSPYGRHDRIQEIIKELIAERFPQMSHRIIPTQRTIIIDELSAERGGIISDFDPFAAFRIHNASPSAFLEEEYKNRELDYKSEFRVDSEDGLITLTSKSDTPELVWRYVFSREFSGMPVLVEGMEGPVDDPKSLTRIENTYMNVDGTWLPETTNYTVAGKRFRKSVHMTWEDQVLNAPISPSEFTLEKMGLSPGTTINNKKAGERRVIDAGL